MLILLLILLTICFLSNKRVTLTIEDRETVKTFEAKEEVYPSVLTCMLMHAIAVAICYFAHGIRIRGFRTQSELRERIKAEDEAAAKGIERARGNNPTPL